MSTRFENSTFEWAVEKRGQKNYTESSESSEGTENCVRVAEICSFLHDTAKPPGSAAHLRNVRVEIMSKLAIWAELEAKPGKEEEVANFLKSAQPLAEKETGTITWYAVRLGGPKFGIFDTFADEKGREAHLTGEIAKALFARAQELFAKEPSIQKLELLAAKVPGVAGTKAKSA
jgi:quinol monooxygenase YgiN